MAPEDPVLTAAKNEAHFRVLLRNNTENSLPEGSVELAVGTRITSGSVATAPEPAQGAPTDVAAPPRTVISTSPVSTLTAGSRNEIRLSLPISELPSQAFSAHGVYALYATYRPSDSGAASDLTAFTPVVWEGPESNTAEVKLSVVVPLVLPPAVETMPTPEELADETPRWEALFDYALRSHATLAIDPRIITAIRAYGTSAPETATELLNRLEHTSLSTFLLQYGDADPAAQAALGADALMQPVGFDFVTRLGTWPEAKPSDTDPQREEDNAEAPSHPAPNDTPSAAETSDTSEPDATTQPPTKEQLEAWPNGLHAAWPAPGRVDTGTASLLGASGIDLTVVRSDNVTYSGGPRAKLGSGTALVTDQELDSGVALAYSGDTRTERRLGAARATARLVLAADQGVNGLALGADRGGASSANAPADVLTTVTSGKWVSLVSFADQAEGSATLRNATQDAERVELLQTAVANEPEVLKSRAVLVQPELLDEYQRMRLLSLFATRYAGADADFATVAAAFAKTDAGLRNGVRIVGASHAQLVGASSNIPIQLRNSLPFDAVVTLTAAPTSAALLLEKRDFPNISIPSDSTERQIVPARSRVSSGESGLALSVTSIDGSFTASTGRLELAIATRVETVAIAALALSVVLLLSFGIWRSVRRRRKGLATGMIPVVALTPENTPEDTALGASGSTGERE